MIVLNLCGQDQHGSSELIRKTGAFRHGAPKGRSHGIETTPPFKARFEGYEGVAARAVVCGASRPGCCAAFASRSDLPVRHRDGPGCRWSHVFFRFQCRMPGAFTISTILLRNAVG
jgi:hypothetical protein